MRHWFFALGVWLLLSLFIAGCRDPGDDDQGVSTGKRFRDRAAVATVQNMRHVVTSGAALCVLGVVTCALTRRKMAGAILAGGGAGMISLYAQIAENPWISVIIILAPILLGTVVLIVYYRTRMRLLETEWTTTELVKAVEPHPEVKQDVGDGDPEVQARVKAIVTPIKNRLRHAGELPITEQSMKEGE